MNATVCSSVHHPVLLHEVITYLDPQPGAVIFDGTLGGGGYTREIIKSLEHRGQVIACDQDQEAITRFGEHPLVRLYHQPFSRIPDIVSRNTLDGAVLDLGISSDQIDSDTRGISFRYHEAPLDMRMNASGRNNLTAWGILNTWSESDIADLIYQYGEERASRRIARSIVAAREKGQMETVGDLVHSVEQVMPRRGRTHVATRTFQAIRIKVNDELGELERFLEVIPPYMKSGGRIVIVSFHSLEDRIIKKYFKTWKQSARARVLTPRVVTPQHVEIQSNPRSRSAKLRAALFV